MVPGVVLRNSLVQADASSATWDDIGASVVVSNGQTYTTDEYRSLIAAHESITGDLICTDMTLPLGSASSGMGSYSGCWYDTPLGLIEQGGSFIKPKGQPYAGLVNNAESRLLPMPNSGVYAEIVNPSGDYSTYFINFRTSEDDQMEPTDPSWGSPFYSWKATAKHQLNLPDGTAWPVGDNLISSQIAYSNNGKWMAVWNGDGKVSRVDLQTFITKEVQVENASEFSSDDFPFMAVSDDGRYIVVAMQGKFLRMYPVDTCFTVYNADGTPGGGCIGYRDLGADLNYFLGTSIQNVYGGVPVFVRDDFLSFYTANTTDKPGDYYEYYFRSPHTSRTDYIALGDSYASGEGEGNDTFYPETDFHGVNMCHLSKESYPFLIGKDLQLDSTHSVACSGAKVLNVLGNGIFDPTLQNPDRTNQYKDKVPNNKLGNWLPGYKAQLNFVSENKPNIITISTIGNDIGFSNIIERCLEPDTCYGTYEDRAELGYLIDSQFEKLVKMYAQIKQSTAPDARIYVIGYPSIVKDDGDCGLRAPLDLNKQETVFANELVSYLNSVIQLAAQKAGVFYVSTFNAFYGHRLCDGAASERAVNGVTVGHDTAQIPLVDKDILSSGSFHPTLLGHRLLAQKIEEMTGDFTAPMPRSDPTVRAPFADDNTSFLMAPKSGRPIQSVNFDDDLSNNIVYRQTSWLSVIRNDGINFSIKPHTSVIGMLHSTPVNLGTFIADDSGTVRATITIPASVPTGFHTLSFSGEGTDGQMHMLFKTIYVAASATDYDGDGVPNSQEPCLFFEVPAGQTTGADYSCETTQTMSISSPSVVDLAVGKSRTTAMTNSVISQESLSSTQGNVFQLENMSPKVSKSPVKTEANPQHHTLWVWVGIGIVVAIVLTFSLVFRYAER